MSAYKVPHPAQELIETINLRVIGPAFAIVHVRLRDVHLRNLTVQRQLDGKIHIRPPKILSRNGNDFGQAYALQPSVRTEIEAAIGILWDRADQADGAG